MLLCGSPAAAALTVSGDAVAGEDNLVPAPVAAVEVEVDKEGPSIVVSWDLSEDDLIRQTAAGTDFTSGGVFVNVNDVAGYEIWRNDELIGEVLAGETVFVDDSVVPGAVYVYAIVAVDAAGNESASAESEEVSVRRPGKKVKMTLDVAAEQVEEILADEQAKGKLMQDLIAVLAAQLGIDPKRIVITKLGVGSLVVEFEVLEDEEDPEAPTAEELVADLNQQIEEDPAALAASIDEGTDLEEVGEEISTIELIEGLPIAFGEVLVDEAATEEVVIVNEEAETQTVSIAIEGDGFDVSDTELVLEPGEEDVITVTFDADAAGNVPGDYSGLLSLITDVPVVETTHELSATIIPLPPVPPIIDLSGVAFKFATVLIDQTKTIVLTISNDGELTLEGELEVVGDDVFTVSEAEFSLAGGEDIDVDVVFAPTAETAYSADIEVTSNDPENPELIVALSGTGVAEVVLVLPGDFDGNSTVNFDDFFLFADQFGTDPASPIWDPVYSLDGDEDVDFDDFFIFADNFGKSVDESAG